jgi:hypothetical protein
MARSKDASRGVATRFGPLRPRLPFRTGLYQALFALSMTVISA